MRSQEAQLKHLILILPVMALSLSACQTSDQNAALGALGGAAVGAAVSGGGDRTTGALVGAAVGVAASTLIGRHKPRANATIVTRTGSGSSPTA